MKANPSPTPELLALFVEIARRGSIAGAARSLDMAPSLATRKLAQLESALKARLFERGVRASRLTEAGTIALKWATSSLSSQREILDELAALQVTPSGQIRIAATHYTAAAHLPEILARFNARYPRISFSILSTDSIVDLVEDGFDIAIHSGRMPDAGVVGHRLRTIPRVICATPGYIGQRSLPQAPSDLADHQCIVHSSNEPHHWYFWRDDSLSSQAIDAFVEANDYSVVLQMARASMGVARLAHSLVRADLDSGRLMRLLPNYECVYGNGEAPALWVLYPNRRVLHRTRLLIEFLRRELETPPSDRHA